MKTKKSRNCFFLHRCIEVHLQDMKVQPPGDNQGHLARPDCGASPLHLYF